MHLSNRNFEEEMMMMMMISSVNPCNRAVGFMNLKETLCSFTHNSLCQSSHVWCSLLPYGHRRRTEARVQGYAVRRSANWVNWSSGGCLDLHAPAS